MLQKFFDAYSSKDMGVILSVVALVGVAVILLYVLLGAVIGGSAAAVFMGILFVACVVGLVAVD